MEFLKSTKYEIINKPKGKDAVNMKICEEYIAEFGHIIEKSKVTVVPQQLANIKGFFEGIQHLSNGLTEDNKGNKLSLIHI